jgi:hypothetical protein
VRCLASCAMVGAKGCDCCILLASDLWDSVVGVFGVVGVWEHDFATALGYLCWEGLIIGWRVLSCILLSQIYRVLIWCRSSGRGGVLHELLS